MRKPLTGQLSVRIHAVKDVEHAVTGRFTRGPETFVIMKVEDAIKAKTKATRTDKWQEEMFTVDIDKANEIELTVYDKSGERPTPVGMLWVRISDIAEEMRRKKIESEFQSAGWVSADRMENGNSPGKTDPSYGQLGTSPGGQFMGAGQPPGQGFNNTSGPLQANPVMVDAWFALEPAGRIHLTLTFGKRFFETLSWHLTNLVIAKQMKDRRPIDLGLNRKGAIRARKEEVHEMHGHKFVQQQFYNIMRCALCGDFLKYAAGMQCTDCKYTCHKKCYRDVVTKCNSKANYETDPEEEKLNHRIPHRFENFSNMGANWCCHCGYLLPLGRKATKKCNGTFHSGASRIFTKY